MIVIVCLDDRNGMLFGGRRQSKDSRLREQVLRLCGERPLWMDPYTADQFTEQAPNIRISEDHLALAKAGDYCFVERSDLAAVAEQIEQLVIYRWNRHYPSDVKFPEALFSDRWEKVSTMDFEGSSHERITQEVYVL